MGLLGFKYSDVQSGLSDKIEAYYRDINHVRNIEGEKDSEIYFKIKEIIRDSSENMLTQIESYLTKMVDCLYSKMSLNIFETLKNSNSARFINLIDIRSDLAQFLENLKVYQLGILSDCIKFKKAELTLEKESETNEFRKNRNDLDKKRYKLLAKLSHNIKDEETFEELYELGLKLIGYWEDFSRRDTIEADNKNHKPLLEKYLHDEEIQNIYMFDEFEEFNNLLYKSRKVKDYDLFLKVKDLPALVIMLKEWRTTKDFNQIR